MNIEFKVYQLKKGTKMYKTMVEDTKQPNEFIIVGEEMLGKLDCYKVHQLDDKGLSLFGGLKIDECAFLLEKKELELKGNDVSYETTELDIPKKYLSMDIIENIQRLNE